MPFGLPDNLFFLIFLTRNRVALGKSARTPCVWRTRFVTLNGRLKGSNVMTRFDSRTP